MLENDLRQDVEDVDINNPSASKEMDIRRYTLIASYLSREQALRVSTDIERFCPPWSDWGLWYIITVFTGW